MNDRSTLLLEHHLKELKLPSFLREYGKMAAQCAAEGVDHPQYLLRLAELEIIDRHQRLVERRIRAARFPAVKSQDTFDFPAIPSLNKALVMELARCEYIQRRENVIAVGNRDRQECLTRDSGRLCIQEVRSSILLAALKVAPLSSISRMWTWRVRRSCGESIRRSESKPWSPRRKAGLWSPIRRRGSGRGGYVVAPVGCSSFGLVSRLRNHYPRFTGALFNLSVDL